MEKTYTPSGKTLKAFAASSAFFRGIMGPYGSGKSTACVMEILKRSVEQVPGPDGIRRTRWAVIRNSFPELKSTTIKTWNFWIPGSYGKMNFGSPITHTIKTPTLHIEMLFMALDQPADAKKLLSLELTGAWVNEAREIDKAIIDALTARVGRYPAKLDGGCPWSGVIADTNPPDDMSWWFQAAEGTAPDGKPEGWEFFKQPGGLTLEAENIENLPEKYYERMIAGKSSDWIAVNVNAQYGYVVEGQPVFPMYLDATHFDQDLKPNENFPLLIACDWGIAPCAIVGQRLADGTWAIIDELMSDDVGVKRFAEKLTSYIELNYPGFTVGTCHGDPSGQYRGKEAEDTCFDLMNTYTPYSWHPAPGDNDIAMRLEAVRNSLDRMIMGKPGFQIGPKCKKLRKGFTGGYHYKTIEGSGGKRSMETPNKNEYSHVHDALQYIMLGAGEASIVLSKHKKPTHPRLQAQRERVNEGREYDMFKTKYKPEGW